MSDFESSFEEKEEKSKDSENESEEMDDQPESDIVPNGHIDENDNINKNVVAQAEKISKVTKPSMKMMMFAAIEHLDNKQGSSLVAIKKYLFSNYAQSNDKRFRFSLLKCIRKCVLDGELKQNKGKYKLITKIDKKTKNKTEKKPKKQLEPTANKKTAEHSAKNVKVEASEKVGKKTKTMKTVNSESKADPKAKKVSATQAKKQVAPKKDIITEAALPVKIAVKKNKPTTVPVLKGRTSLTTPVEPKNLKKGASKFKIIEPIEPQPQPSTSKSATKVTVKSMAQLQDTPKRKKPKV